MFLLIHIIHSSYMLIDNRALLTKTEVLRKHFNYTYDSLQEIVFLNKLLHYYRLSFIIPVDNTYKVHINISFFYSCRFPFQSLQNLVDLTFGKIKFCGIHV